MKVLALISSLLLGAIMPLIGFFLMQIVFGMMIA